VEAAKDTEAKLAKIKAKKWGKKRAVDEAMLKLALRTKNLVRFSHPTLPASERSERQKAVEGHCNTDLCAQIMQCGNVRSICPRKVDSVEIRADLLIDKYTEPI
jgi:hypothetical protein